MKFHPTTKTLIVLAIALCFFWIYTNIALGACIEPPTRQDATGIPAITYPYSYQGVLDPGDFHKWPIISERHEHYDNGIPYYVIIKNPNPDSPIRHALVEIGQDYLLRITGFAYYHQNILVVYGSVRLIDGLIRYVKYPVTPMQRQFIEERLPKEL